MQTIGLANHRFRNAREKTHKHKQFCPVTAWVRGGLPTRRPEVKSSCAVCAEAKESKNVRPTR